MTFRALLVEKDESGAVSAAVQDLDDARLPDGDVTVAVEYSTLNYKDGLCITGKGGLVRTFPHVPGVFRPSHMGGRNQQINWPPLTSRTCPVT